MGFIIAILWYFLAFFTGAEYDNTSQIDDVINSKSVFEEVTVVVDNNLVLEMSDEKVILDNRNRVETWDDPELEPTFE